MRGEKMIEEKKDEKYYTKVEIILTSRSLPAMQQYAHALYTLVEKIKQQASDENVHVNWMVSKSPWQSEPINFMIFDKEKGKGVDVDIVDNRVIVDNLTSKDV